jgi:SAM-dependent methyltransferase
MVNDEVTKGMSSWNSEDDASIANYTEWQANLLRPHLGGSTLEVGAGTGRMAELIVRGTSFTRYVALEPSQHFYPMLARRVPQVEALNGTIDSLGPEFDRTFDVVFSSHVLEHIEDDLSFLRSVDRLVKPGGKIVTLVPALNWLMSPLDHNIGHYRRYDKRMVRSLAARLGYEEVLTRYDNLIGVAGYWWVCKAKKTHYQDSEKKQRLVGAFKFFDRAVLPMMSRFERLVPPPIGLSLTSVLRKPLTDRA